MDHQDHNTIALLKENLAFVLTAVVIMAAIILLSVFAEKILRERKEKNDSAAGIPVPKENKTKKLATIGLLSALGGALTLFEIPMFVFYNLDFSEIPALLAGLLLGPVAGTLVEFIKVFIHVLFHGTHSAFVGEFAMFVTGCFLVLPASFFYWGNKTRKNAVIGLLSGVFSLLLLGGLFNGFYLIPKFAVLFGMPIDEMVAAMQGTFLGGNIHSLWTIVAFATVPFNLLKGVVMTLCVFFIYKPLSRLYRKG